MGVKRVLLITTPQNREKILKYNSYLLNRNYLYNRIISTNDCRKADAGIILLNSSSLISLPSVKNNIPFVISGNNIEMCSPLVKNLFRQYYSSHNIYIEDVFPDLAGALRFLDRRLHFFDDTVVD